MWVLILILGMVTLVLAWTCFLYFVYLAMAGLLRRPVNPELPPELPFVSVVVPCYNEADEIRDKIEDIRELEYPRSRLEVVFADGGSADGTADILRRDLTEEWARIEACPRKGKIHQINHVLPLLRGGIVLVTDVDGRLAPQAVLNTVAVFAVSPDAGVVGAYCEPRRAMPIESYFWAANNRARFLESDAGSASFVIGVCYAFRRELFDRFPDDVVADDVFVSYTAHAAQKRVIYTRFVKAKETRSPSDLAQLLPHKFRKSNAVLRESLRFAYRLPDMTPAARVMFLTRLCQQLLMPLSLVLWLMVVVSLLSLGHPDVVIMAVAFLLASLILTSRVFAWVKLPEREHRYPLTLMIKGFAMGNFILLATALSYPFYRQGSSYRKTGPSGDAAGPA